MSKILLAKKVITDQENLEIARAELIGISKMEQVLEIIIKSLKSNDTTKFKAFIEAMQESRLKKLVSELNSQLHVLILDYHSLL